MLLCNMLYIHSMVIWEKTSKLKNAPKYLTIAIINISCMLTTHTLSFNPHNGPILFGPCGHWGTGMFNKLAVRSFEKVKILYQGQRYHPWATLSQTHFTSQEAVGKLKPTHPWSSPNFPQLDSRACQGSSLMEELRVKDVAWVQLTRGRLGGLVC